MATGLLSSLWAGLTAGGVSNEEPSRPQDAQSAKDIPEITHTEAEEHGSDTPKASAQQPPTDVPTFLLSEHDSDQTTPSAVKDSSPPKTDQLPTPTPSPSRLMAPPPPPPPPPTGRNNQSSLRIPTTGPLPNRGPPSASQQRAGTSGARGKVLLSPGHSPMDWASLTRSSNLSGVSGFQRVTPAEMKAMNGRKGKPIWSSWQGKVYNITPYLPFHPGGEKELMKAAGRDATRLFMDIHPWVNWEGMLSACLVGVLVSEDLQKSSLESID